MRRDDPGAVAGRVDGTAAPGAGAPATALRSGSADQLAALVARAARAPSGLIHVVDGDSLKLHGGWGLGEAGSTVADTPLRGSIFGLVVESGEPLAIDDHRGLPAPAGVADVRGAYLGQPICDDQGTVIGVCSAVDPVPRRWEPDAIAAVAEAARVSTLLITEQRAARELDQQRRFLDAVLDSLHDGVTACDATGRIVFVNARMQQMWADSGLTPTAGTDGVIAGLFDGEGNPRRGDDIGLYRALRGHPVRRQELVLRGPARRTLYYQADAHPITGPDGSVIGAVQAVHDVTRRRRVERFRMCQLGVTTALAEARTVAQAGPRVLEAVVRTLDWAHAELWLTDSAAGVARAVARYSAPAWPQDISVPDSLPYGQGLAGRVWQVGKPLWIRDVGRPQSLISPETAAGSRLHTALAVPVRHGQEPLGVLCVFADTIEDPEDEVVALLSGIAAHIAQFVDRRLVEDLQRQLTRSKNEYLALVGHELRTPLTSISAYTEILREIDGDALAQEGPALLEVVDRNTTQLRHIIDELLEMSALDAGHATLSMAPIDLAEVVRESVESTRAAIVGSPLTLVDDLPGELVIPGDRRRLRQIVDNLLGNAVKYSPDGGRITVRLRTDERAAELTVADTGIGVTPEDQEKLFTRLYRSSTVRDRAIPGTGLGLALSRTIAQRHHGTIELLGQEGPGTTVVVRLPLDQR